LPPELREVSGLTATGSDTVLAVGDEQALIFEIELTTARVRSRIQVGDPILLGDFEGIERIDQTIYLVDSQGTLVAGRKSEKRGFARFTTDLADGCEIEGLAQDPQTGFLYMLCKKLKGKANKARVKMFAFSADTHELVPRADLDFDGSSALSSLGGKNLSPSGLVFSPDGQTLTVVAAKQHALLVFSRAGELLHVQQLPKAGRHRQTEGVALLPDGRIVLADEGGNKAGRLSVYPYVQR